MYRIYWNTRKRCYSIQIRDNPYRHESFVTVGDERERPVESAYATHLTTNRLVRSHRKPIIRAEGVVFSREEAA